MRIPETWDLVKNITTSIQYSASAVAIVVGALWAMWRFQIFRELKPRVTFNIEIEKFSNDRHQATLIDKCRVRNTGNVEIDLGENRDRCFLRYKLLVSPVSQDDDSIVISKPRRELDPVSNIFIEHGWIERGEEIDDVRVIVLPVGNWLAVQFELVIWGYSKSILYKPRKIRYSAATAFQIAEHTSTSSYASDDEQAEYEEYEWAINKIEQQLKDLKRKEGSLAETKKEEVSELVIRARSLVSLLKKALKDDGANVQYKEIGSVIEMLDKQLR